MSTVALSERTMSENRYALAGWLAIAQAVLLPLAISIDLVQGLLGAALFDYTGPSFGPGDLLYLMFICFSVYTLIKLRELLHERFAFHGVDGLITLAILWNILSPASLLLIVGFLLLTGAPSGGLATVAILSHFAISMLTMGLIDILIGMKLMILRESMSDSLKALSYLTLAMGIAEVTVFLSPLALILLPIWCVILGMIFLREKEEAEFV